MSRQIEGDGLNNNQLCALFENCLKLASENKITAKNTWDLPLIDHLSDLVQVRTAQLCAQIVVQNQVQYSTGCNAIAMIVLTTMRSPHKRVGSFATFSAPA